MRALLDSHALLWLAEEPERLSSTVLASLQPRQSELFLSVVSEWELLIKEQKGKLRLYTSVIKMVEYEIEEWNLQRLPVLHRHVQQYSTLPLYHGDPFDRMLIAQAIAEDLTIVTTDTLFTRYNVKTIW